MTLMPLATNEAGSVRPHVTAATGVQSTWHSWSLFEPYVACSHHGSPRPWRFAQGISHAACTSTGAGARGRPVDVMDGAAYRSGPDWVEAEVCFRTAADCKGSACCGRRAEGEHRSFSRCMSPLKLIDLLWIVCPLGPALSAASSLRRRLLILRHIRLPCPVPCSEAKLSPAPAQHIAEKPINASRTQAIKNRRKRKGLGGQIWTVSPASGSYRVASLQRGPCFCFQETFFGALRVRRWEQLAFWTLTARYVIGCLIAFAAP